MVKLSRALPDLEPSCPKCGNANAMLHKMVETTYTGWVSYLVCRDCGHSVRESDAKISGA